MNLSKRVSLYLFIDVLYVAKLTICIIYQDNIFLLGVSGLVKRLMLAERYSNAFGSLFSLTTRALISHNLFSGSTMRRISVSAHIAL